MRVYERDDIRVPAIFTRLSAKQLKRISLLLEKFTKRPPQKRHTSYHKIKFY